MFLRKFQNKSLRKRIVDYVYNIINDSKYPNELIGLYIFSIHGIIGQLIIVSLILALKYKKERMLNIILVIVTITCMTWFYFDGCIITLIEMKLLKHKYNHNDLVFYLFNLNEETHEYKKHVAIVLNLIIMLVVTIISLKKYNNKIKI